MSVTSQKRRSRRYFAHKKYERSYNRWLIESQGASEYSKLDKLRIKKGGKHAALVYMRDECANMQYWEMCP